LIGGLARRNDRNDHGSAAIDKNARSIPPAGRQRFELRGVVTSGAAVI